MSSQIATPSRSNCSTNAASAADSAPPVQEVTTPAPSPPPPPSSQKHSLCLIDPSAPCEPDLNLHQLSISPSSTPDTTAITTSTSPVIHTNITSTSTNQATDALGPHQASPSSSSSITSSVTALTLDSAIDDMQSYGESENAAFAQGTSANSSSYAIRKTKLVIEFVAASKKLTPHYDKFLTCTKNLPSHFTMPKAEVLFLMLGGKEDRHKKVRTLNVMLIDWIGSRRKVDGGYPSPSTINSDLRCFFAATKDYFDWDYTHADFKFDGGYIGYFTTMIAKRQKEDVSTSYPLSLTFSPIIIFLYHPLINIIILHLQLLSSADLWREE